MEGVIRLRTLTRKSTMPEGLRSAGYTIGKILDSLDVKAVLRAYYYNSRISFTDDVLNEVGVTGDLRIEKPGKDPNKYKENVYNLVVEFQKGRDSYHSIKNEDDLMRKTNSKRISIKKSRKSEYSNRERRFTNKESGKRWNHGHR